MKTLLSFFFFAVGFGAPTFLVAQKDLPPKVSTPSSYG